MSDTLAWAGEYGWVLQVWAEYHEVKEGVLLHISAIIERHGAEIAFPTRTLHVAGDVRLAGTAARLPDPLDR